jgi:hypothetical protein
MRLPPLGHPKPLIRLTLVAHEHINMLGRYSFTAPESVARREHWDTLADLREDPIKACIGARESDASKPAQKNRSLDS